MIRVEYVKLSDSAIMPKYANSDDAGMDLHADINHEIDLMPGEIAIVRTGIAIGLRAGFEGQIRSRSGLACKHGICVVNSPGTIDAGYTGEIKVGLINLGEDPFKIHQGMRIAQLVIKEVEHALMFEVESLGTTQRGAKGFGSTGV